MKKLLLIFFVFCSFAAMAQRPVQTLGNKYNIVKVLGILAADSGYVNGYYPDTATASRSDIAKYPGSQIRVDNTLYLRDGTATKWIIAGGYGVSASNITILNDSSISICSTNSCDTFKFTNIVVNNFSVINDSTILICDGNNTCDTLYITPTQIAKSYVDSTKIIGNDSLYYYINGNAYLGGVISSSGTSSVSVYNDSTLVICNANGCDSFKTTIVISNFTVLNDSTIIVCPASGSCDTININPTVFAKSYVDSTKIVNGILYYYVNGNAYSGGTLPVWVSKAQLDSAANIKLNITDTTGKWIPVGSKFPIGVIKPIIALNDSTLRFDSLNLTEIRYSLASRDTTNWTDTTLIDKKYFNDRLASYTPGGSGGGGISQVVGVSGVANVNDSTVRLDTAFAKTIFYNKNSVDSGLVSKIDSIKITSNSYQDSVWGRKNGVFILQYVKNRVNTPIALTDGATITWDCKVSLNDSVTIAGNRTLAITNSVAGMVGIIVVKQDATGSRTLTLPANSKVANGGAGVVTLTSTANAKDVLAFYYDGTNYFWTYRNNFN